MQYRRTPLLCGYNSPSELLNGRKIRTAIDVLFPSPAHQAQERQSKQAAKAAQRLAGRSGPQYGVGTPCYALYSRDKDHDGYLLWSPKYVELALSVSESTQELRPIWRRHVEQLRPRYVSEEDVEPGETPTSSGDIFQMVEWRKLLHRRKTESSNAETTVQRKRQNPRMPTGNEYGPDRPRRST